MFQIMSLCRFFVLDSNLCAPFQMPHESTVDHESPSDSTEDFSTPIAMRSRSDAEEYTTANKRARLVHQDTDLPNLRAVTPQKVTHHFDEDASDDESSSSSASDSRLGAE